MVVAVGRANRLGNGWISMPAAGGERARTGCTHWLLVTGFAHTHAAHDYRKMVAVIRSVARWPLDGYLATELAADRRSDPFTRTARCELSANVLNGNAREPTAYGQTRRWPCRDRRSLARKGKLSQDARARVCVCVC